MVSSVLNYLLMSKILIIQEFLTVLYMYLFSFIISILCCVTYVLGLIIYYHYLLENIVVDSLQFGFWITLC